MASLSGIRSMVEPGAIRHSRFDYMTSKTQTRRRAGEGLEVDFSDSAHGN